MSTSKATARPVRVRSGAYGQAEVVRSDERYGSWVDVLDSNGEEFCAVLIEESDPTGKCEDAAIDRAALIVRAVNSHDALVAALQSWMDFFNNYMDALEPGDPLRHAVKALHGDRVAQSRAALALAEQD